MRRIILLTGLFFLITLFNISLQSQSTMPYKLSLEGINPMSLQLDDTPSFLNRTDSLMQRAANMIPIPYRMKQLESEYLINAENENLPIHLNIYTIADFSDLDYNSILDQAEIAYEGYRYLFEFDHGYFGPALGPMTSRSIPKSIYTDVLYPWQNAPQSKVKIYKALYLITNFVYPSDDQ